MVTSSWMRVGLVGFVMGCGGRDITSAAVVHIADGQVSPPAGSRIYDAAQGFVVHEWGTNTIVVGTDGVLLPGLHHEEEDLPSFVYDRMKATKLGAPVEVKMETPVDYFYAPTPMTARVSVSFPKGVFTQWYPGVQSFYPLLANPTGAGPRDPALDPTYPFQQAVCREHYGKVENGLLDWGPIDIGARAAKPSLPGAAVDKYTWSYARQVASNPVHVGKEDEQFLFYRGLGNAPLPVTVTASSSEAGYDGGLVLRNTDAQSSMGSVVVMRVSAKGGAFKVHPEGIAPGGDLAEDAPAASEELPMGEFVSKLSETVLGALTATGLYGDEAAAMVNTWKQQWFKTPGVRVLYMMPQSWTDKQIPLTVEPAPNAMLRVMMIRVEVLTRALEDEDLKFAAVVDSQGPDGSAAAHFTALGRFAEPRLRRAIALLGAKAGAIALLTRIAGPSVTVAQGE